MPECGALGDAERAARQSLPALTQAQYADVVAARRQHEGDLGVGKKVDLVDRAPRRDVIGLGADDEHRRADVAQRDRPPVHHVASLGQIVVEEQTAQVFRVHAVGHAGGVRVPRHEVGHRRALAQQVFVHEPRPDSRWSAASGRRPPSARASR